MPWGRGAARSCTYCHICCGGASFLTFCYMYDTCIHCCLSVHTPLFFGWRGYTNYQMLGNGDIRSLHMFLVLFLLFIFRYDVPACGCRVPFIYVVHDYLLFLFMMMMLDISCLEFGCCRLYWYLYVLIGGWDWPGVGIGVPICIVCLFPTIRRPVLIFGPGGLLSVK